MPWYAFGFLAPDAWAPRLVFGEVATHNHFVFDRGRTVFGQTAPVLKLSAEATEDEHLGLLAVLNSSTACFWLQQVCQPKPGYTESWTARYAFNAGNVAEMPLPSVRPPGFSRALDEAARERASLLDSLDALLRGTDQSMALDALAERDEALLYRMISLQEELDWQTLALYGLLDEDLSVRELDAPDLALGQRAFEIALADRVASGKAHTTWFDSHRSPPITEPPAHWPPDYRDLVQRRIELVRDDREVGLIERPEGKRRWHQDTWAERETSALKGWLLDQLEERELWDPPGLRTAGQLADALRGDSAVEAAVARLEGTRDADLGTIVERLIIEQAVPYLAARRYSLSGLRKCAEWERTRRLQRVEDELRELAALPPGHPLHLTENSLARRRRECSIDAIPVPPCYKAEDFLAKRFWDLRGKLDVPKERFVLVADAARAGDRSPVIGWAGWSHAERALALANEVGVLRDRHGATEVQLVPLLAGVLEILPWVHQWHAEPDPETGQALGEELEGFLDDHLGLLGRTREDLIAWRPPASERRGGRRGATAPA